MADGRSAVFSRMIANVWHNGQDSVRDVCFLGTTTMAVVGTLEASLSGETVAGIYNMLGTRRTEPTSPLARSLQQAKNCGLKRDRYGAQ